jgi:predicted permease
VIAVVALAMGIGFTTTMFSIVHGATRPLPFADPHEIVAIEKRVTRAGVDGSTRPYDYRLWVDAARSFDVLGAYESVALNLAAPGGEPERLTGAAITSNVFVMLGARAQLGRTLQADDMRPGATRVVVLSHGLWQRRFGGAGDVIGSAVRLTGVDHVVIGVMPARFGFPVNAAFWTPMPLAEAASPPGTGPRLVVFGRLRDGSSMASAGAELDALTASGLDQTAAGRVRVAVIPFQDIETPRDVIRGLYLLVVAVSFVLLIACANVANLLLARAAARSREVAVRLALGATRRQLLLEHLGEALSLAAAATVLGVALAHAGTRLFAVNTAHIIEAFWVDFRVDAVVLLFASALAAVATLIAGGVPALRAARSNVAEVLKDRAFGSSGLSIGRFSRSMIAVQVALACGLLALTMILARSAVNVHSVPWPFDPSSLLTFEFELPDGGADVADRNRRLRELAAAIGATPGVEAAALTTALPGRGSSWTFSLDAPAVDERQRTTAAAFVTPDFFAITRTHLRRGRLLTWQDDESAERAAVVNESFARRYSGDRDPIGRRIFIGTRDFTIVGVVSDVMAGDIQDREQDGFYTSILQSRPFGVRVMARGAGQPLELLPAIRETLRGIDPDMPITEVFTLREAVYRDKRVLDVLSTLFLVFGAGALSLTAIGLYALVSFSVAQRRREIGIRLALGSTRRHVLALVVGQGSRQLIAGLAAGLLLAMGLSRAFAAAVEQLPAADAPLLVVLSLAIAVTVAIALAVPARRASRLDLLDALRRD